MNDKPKPKSKWYWRLLRWGLIGVAVLATLAAILITEENWRGKRDWEAYKREAEARGERLDVASVTPPPVPDDQNFYCTPIVARMLQAGCDSAGENTNTNAAKNPIDFNVLRGHMDEWINQEGNWQKGTLTDLKQWQDAFRRFSSTPEGATNGFPVPPQPQTPAADVLLALSVFDPALEELRQASLRPYMRMSLNYENYFEFDEQLLPWLATIKRTVQFLELRIVAEEQNNEPQQALDDLKLLLRFSDCIREQPSLISHLVHIAIQSIALQPVYEGLAQHCWSDSQLKELEGTLTKEDFLAEYQFTMNGEKVFAIDTFEKQRITREIKLVVDSSGTNQTLIISMRWVPSAFFYQNELAFARMYQKFILPLVDSTNRIAAPAALYQAETEFQSQMKHFSPYQVQAQMLFPAIARSVVTFATDQARVDLARVACALERYRLAHGEYPATVDTLAPQYIEKLPHDIINGQPLHYRRTDDGRFVLYSVGWNEKDDGGTAVLTKSGTVDRENGDWVWQYPAK